MEVCIYDAEGKKTIISYFLVNDYFKKVCEKYINTKLWNDFIKNYTHFDPYFDFCFLELGYSMENVFFIENSYLVAYNNSIYLLNDMSYEKYNNELENITYPLYNYFDKIDDSTTNIHSIEDEKQDFSNGLINKINTFFDMGNLMCHNDIALKILNQYLISNEEIGKLYKAYISKNSSLTPIMFFEEEFGYIRFVYKMFGEIILVYSGSKISINQKAYIDYLSSHQQFEEIIKLDKDRQKTHCK